MPRGVVEIDPNLTLGQTAPRRAARTVQAFNKDLKNLTEAQAGRLNSTDLTDIINADAVTVLGKSARTKTTVPFDGGVKNNPYATALTHRVPLNIYQADNVWRRDEQGNISFQPWLWRFATTPAMNQFIRNYNQVNCQGDAADRNAFPKDEFDRQKRRVRNRGYKRNQRAREEAPDTTPTPEPEPRTKRRAPRSK